MREIKFRAWDRHREDVQMITWEMMQTSRYAKPGCGWWNDCSYTLMQFTGLRDKNGKEIYEGDIVELDVPMKFEVIYTRCYFAIKINENQSMILTGLESSSQVIGNIYENPELTGAR